MTIIFCAASGPLIECARSSRTEDGTTASRASCTEVAQAHNIVPARRIMLPMSGER